VARSRPAVGLTAAALLLAACGAGGVAETLRPSLVAAEPPATLAAALDARALPEQQTTPDTVAVEAVPTRPDTTGSVSISTHAVIGARGMPAAPPRSTPIPGPPPRTDESTAATSDPATQWRGRDLVVPGTVATVVEGYVAMLEVAGLEATTQVVSSPLTGTAIEVFATEGDAVVASVTVSAAVEGVAVTERWAS
jgi:biotin carboxyl carrier protein